MYWLFMKHGAFDFEIVVAKNDVWCEHSVGYDSADMMNTNRSDDTSPNSFQIQVTMQHYEQWAVPRRCCGRSINISVCVLTRILGVCLCQCVCIVLGNAPGLQTQFPGSLFHSA